MRTLVFVAAFMLPYSGALIARSAEEVHQVEGIEPRETLARTVDRMPPPGRDRPFGRNTESLFADGGALQQARRRWRAEQI